MPDTPPTADWTETRLVKRFLEKIIQQIGGLTDLFRLSVLFSSWTNNAITWISLS